MQIVYDKKSGNIIRTLPIDQDILTNFYYYPSEIKDNLSSIVSYNIPKDLRNYYIKDKKLMRKTEEEITEIKHFGRVLTEEERVNEMLMPSREEIQKAENTIEILSILQEVGVV